MNEGAGGVEVPQALFYMLRRLATRFFLRYNKEQCIFELRTRICRGRLLQNVKYCFSVSLIPAGRGIAAYAKVLFQ